MTKPANPMRGEATFELDGKAYVLRPSFEALVAAEEEIGSLFALVERAAQGSLKLAEVAALLWHCIDPEQRPDRAEVGAAVLDMGMLAATRPLRAIFAQVLKGQR